MRFSSDGSQTEARIREAETDSQLIVPIMCEPVSALVSSGGDEAEMLLEAHTIVVRETRCGLARKVASSLGLPSVAKFHPRFS